MLLSNFHSSESTGEPDLLIICFFIPSMINWIKRSNLSESFEQAVNCESQHNHRRNVGCEAFRPEAA